MTTAQFVLLDVRETPSQDRHARIFRRFDALEKGASFVLVIDHDPEPLLDLFQHERDGLFDWSPLEEGPEVWRIAITRRVEGDAPGRSISEYLGWDHDRLDALIEAARGAMAAASVDEARRNFSEFRTGLLRHIRMEEEVLFPAFENATGMGDSGPTAVMRQEHWKIQRILEEIRTFLDAPNPSAGEFNRLHASLLSILADHNAKEEQVVYPLTDRHHLPAEREEVIRRMQAI